jgi:hypothetical protein
MLTNKQHVYAQQNVNDTILSYAVIYNGDTIEAKTLPALGLYSKLTDKQRSDLAKWTRLRNAVYVTYPYAKRAGAVLNDINAHLVSINKEEDRKKFFDVQQKKLEIEEVKAKTKAKELELKERELELIAMARAKEVEVKAKEVELKRQAEDNLIMNADLTNMSEAKRAWFEKRQKEILERPN